MKTAAKERPILFSSPMIRAILDGRKTVTRRVIKPQESIHGPCDDGRLYWIPPGMQGDPDPNCPTIFAESKCPFGSPGDRLWVRETWCPLRDEHYHDGAASRDALRHRNGDGAPIRSGAEYRADVTSDDSDRCMRELGYRWSPSIHMPRWASRITLEVKSITAERLQDITEEDAIREGAQCAGVPASLTDRGGFAKLWEQINGRGSWAANPWVWRIEFERVAISAK